MNQSTLVIAGKVLAKISVLDKRIGIVTEDTIMAWAEVFEGQDIFLAEALDAVRDYYRQTNPFPIFPGDILGAIQAMPKTSSPERTNAHIDKWSNYPYSQVIQDLTGTSWHPTYPTPEGIHGDTVKERAYHQAEFKAWIDDNRTQLVQAAIGNAQKGIGQ